MGKLGRKNLILDVDELRELAAARGTSESALVRELVREELSHARTKEKIAAALTRFDAWLDADDEMEAGDKAADAAP